MVLCLYLFVTCIPYDPIMQSCTQVDGNFIKNLSVTKEDPSKVFIVDNSPIAYALNSDSAIPISGWSSDPNDEALLDLLPFLDALRFANDVRSVLSLRNYI
jgi:CTD nuclear envelope phosphatase 1